MFITFEGIEGCGKTTQVKLLGEALERQGIPCLLTREPGGSKLGGSIRRLLLDPLYMDMDPLAELFLYLADRAQHTAVVVGPALEQGHWVICDRYADATTAYQGYARGLDLALVARLNEVATRGLWPQLTFLLDCPPEIGLRRARARPPEPTREDRFELHEIAFHRQVRHGYLRLAAEHENRYRVLDATADTGTVHRQVMAVIEPYLRRHGGPDRSSRAGVAE